MSLFLWKFDVAMGLCVGVRRGLLGLGGLGYISMWLLRTRMNKDDDEGDDDEGSINDGTAW